MFYGKAFQTVGAATRNACEAKESLWAGTVSALDWLEGKPEQGASRYCDRACLLVRWFVRS